MKLEQILFVILVTVEVRLPVGWGSIFSRAQRATRVDIHMQSEQELYDALL